MKHKEKHPTNMTTTIFQLKDATYDLSVISSSKLGSSGFTNEATLAPSHVTVMNAVLSNRIPFSSDNLPDEKGLSHLTGM